MKLCVISFITIIGVRAAVSLPETCGTLSGCYLYDLRTGVETALVQSKIVEYDYVEGASRHSILCDVDGTINQIEFAFLPEGKTHRTWAAPFWIDGSSGDWVEDSDWLQSCGAKTLVVEGSTWKDKCFNVSFELNAKCDGEESSVSGDMNIRFSKITKADAPSTLIDPLTAEDYPMGGDLAKVLATTTTAVSVMVPTDYMLRNRNVPDYVKRVGGAPTNPNSDPNHPFWDDFRVVVQAQQRRRNGDMSDLNLPELWRAEEFDVTDVALAVQHEFPGHWQARLCESFFQQGVKVDHKVFPWRSNADFVGGPVRVAALNTWAIINVSPTNFRMKWMYGRPRPEEIAFKIQTGEIPLSAVPQDIMDILSQWKLNKQEEFTAYPEGAPRHPSWPAMHSAASSASFWMMIAFDLTEEQKCQALLTDYIVSYGRTVAGVHYPTDNIAGLNLGQEILADILADHLVEAYGADRSATEAKIKASRFDWNYFDPQTCSFKG